MRPEATLTTKRQKSAKKRCPGFAGCDSFSSRLRFLRLPGKLDMFETRRKKPPQIKEKHLKIDTNGSTKLFEKNLASGTLRKPPKSAQSRLFCLRVRFSSQNGSQNEREARITFEPFRALFGPKSIRVLKLAPRCARHAFLVFFSIIMLLFSIKTHHEQNEKHPRKPKNTTANRSNFITESSESTPCRSTLTLCDAGATLACSIYIYIYNYIS